MSDTADLIKNVITGLLAGGASAGTAFFATQGNLKKRLEAIEEQLGSHKDPKTGLHQTVADLQELVRRLRKDFDDFEEAPPSWVAKLMTRSRTASGINLEITEALEDKIRAVSERVKRVEEGRDSRFISREEYDSDNRERTREGAKIREDLTATNGMLKGMVTMMGIDMSEKQRPPRS